MNYNYFCCHEMKFHITAKELALVYHSAFREYGIIYLTGYIPGNTINETQNINFCPWCGSSLPSSLRHKNIEILRKMGFEPFSNDDKIPKKFRTDKWWINEIKKGKMPILTQEGWKGPWPSEYSKKIFEDKSTLFDSDIYNEAMLEMIKPQPNIGHVKRLLRKGIKKKHGLSAYALGTWYMHGVNIKKNRKKALKLIKIAAEESYPEALHDLGVYYQYTQDEKRNLELAFDCYMKAFIAGETASKNKIKKCYCYGIGTKKDERLLELFSTP